MVRAGGEDDRLAICQMLILQRKLASDIVGQSLSANPVWDMLLELYAAEREGRLLYIWPLSVAGNIPISSAHRKIDLMVQKNMVVRTTDESDRRRVGIALSAGFSEKLEALFDRLAAAAPRLSCPCQPHE